MSDFILAVTSLAQSPLFMFLGLIAVIVALCIVGAKVSDRVHSRR